MQTILSFGRHTNHRQNDFGNSLSCAARQSMFDTNVGDIDVAPRRLVVINYPDVEQPAFKAGKVPGPRCHAFVVCSAIGEELLSGPSVHKRHRHVVALSAADEQMDFATAGSENWRAYFAGKRIVIAARTVFGGSDEPISRPRSKRRTIRMRRNVREISDHLPSLEAACPKVPRRIQ